MSGYGYQKNDVGVGVALGGYAATTPVDVSCAGELQQVQNRLEEMLKRLNANVCHLHGVADRVFGPIPQPCGESAKDGPATTELQRIHRLISDAEKLSDLLASAADRMSRL